MSSDWWCRARALSSSGLWRAVESEHASRGRRRGVRSLLVGAVVTIGIGALGVGSALAGWQPEMHFDHRMRIATVCFSVTNPAGGQSTLYGLRYSDTRGRVDPATPAIVLVHGIASSTENWDFSPTWSVARALAAAGYVVYSYDRLGYAKSSYFAQPGGGDTLTTAAHRAELHRSLARYRAAITRPPRAATALGDRGRADSRTAGW